MPRKNILTLIISLAVCGLGFFQNVIAETQVTQVHRLSHPAFSMSNNGQNARQPWNVDKSRILLSESGTVTNAHGNSKPYLHPDFPTQRGTLNSSVEPFKSEEAWEVYSGNNYKRRWGRLWVPNSLQQWTSEGKTTYAKKSGNSGKDQVTGDNASWFYDAATDTIYVHAYDGGIPSAYSINFVSNSRNNIWGCLTDACVTAANASGNTAAVLAIDATLPALNFDGVYDLDAAGKLASLAAWEKNTIDLPESSSYYDRPHWSPYADEPNIIYKLDRNRYKLIAYNVDTGVAKDVASYDPQFYGESIIGGCSRKIIVDGVETTTKEIDLKTAQIYGFSKTALVAGDPHQYYMVILLEWGCTDGEWGQTYVIDMGKSGYWNYPNARKIGQKQSVWHYCGDNNDNQRTWYPKDQSIHTSGSPDGQYYVWDHSGPLVGKTTHRSETNYTITTSNVDVNANSITLPTDPGWRVGDGVWYYNNGGASVGGLESYYRAQPLHPNDYWVKTKNGRTITLSDTPDGPEIDLTSAGNNAQYFGLSNPGYCHDYTKSLGTPAGLGILTMYIPEYWWSHDNDITHPSWFGNNNSFVIGNFSGHKSAPNIFDMKIYEYTFDRNTPIPNNTYHRQDNLIPRITLLTRKSVGMWDDQYNNAADNGVNYHGGLPSVTDSLDYSQLFFAGTGKQDGSFGRYTRQDYAWCQAHPAETICGSGIGQMGDLGWEGVGAYIAMLNSTSTPANPADVNDDGHVNIKDIQACIKVITGSSLTYENQCRVLAAPTENTNIKDIQVIIRAIIEG